MSKPTLLYVEDDPTNAFVMVRLLRNNLEVTVASSAENCFEKLRERTFDIILMDINLGNGKLDGVQCKDIIKDKMKIETPIIALTSYTTHINQESFLDIGFDNYITKPVEKAVLIEEIEKTLNK